MSQYSQNHSQQQFQSPTGYTHYDVGTGAYNASVNASIDAQSQNAYFSGPQRHSFSNHMQPRFSQANDFDFEPLEADARNQAPNRDLHTLTKSTNETPYVFGLRQGQSHPQPIWQQPRQSGAGPATEPLPQRGPNGTYCSSQSTSEGADSGYKSLQRPGRPTGVDDYSTNPLEFAKDLQQSALATASNGGLNPAFGLQHFPQCAHNQQTAQTLPDNNEYPGQQRPSGGRGRRAQLPPCRECGKPLKNQSDATKHSNTHIRPFVCQEPGCSRKEGFATSNDLERHRKSVHEKSPVVGTKEGYICIACPRSAGNEKLKFWPRKDNFKAHVKRKHKDRDEKQMLERSKVDRRPDDAQTVITGPTNIVKSSQADQDDNYQEQFLHPISSPMTPYPSNQGASLLDFSYNNENEFDNMGAHTSTPTGQPSNFSFLDSSIPLEASSNFEVQPQPQQQQYQDLQQQPLRKRQRPNEYDDDDDYGSEQVPSISQWGPAYTSDTIGGFSSSQQPAASNDASSSIPPINSGSYQCQVCFTTRPRECDLKKHMKRHTRPYGCTFPDCSKRFGSRNDWKRHECSQHFLHETWKCGHTSLKTGVVCTNPVIHSQDIMDGHLQGSDHKIVNQQERDRLCREYRLGKDGHEHFWCGFCEDLIKQEKKCENAWAPRFKHIGDHYDKEDRKVSDWICIRYNKAKGSVTADDKKRERKKAQRGRCDEGDDEQPSAAAP